METTIPGKTFLFGEYGSLIGGPAVIITTYPGFLVNDDNAENKFFPHPKSPAGLYFEKNKDCLNKLVINFEDNYAGLGGFGASTAEFLCLWNLVNANSSDLQKLWDDYRSIFASNRLKPSGYDLVAQKMGGLVRITSDEQMVSIEAKPIEWPWKDWDITLVHTGFKVPTHDHLSGVNLTDLVTLKNLNSRIVKFWDVKNKKEFCLSIKDWNTEVEKLNLIADSTKNLILKFSNIKGVFAIKGCGAMGSDVLALFHSAENIESIHEHLFDLGFLNIYSFEDMFSEGEE